MNGFSQILANIADNTEPNANKGDYIKDGLLYCGKCNTPKQVRIKLCGVEKKPNCMCKCEAKKQKAQQEKIKSIFHKEEIERARSALDLKLTNWTFDAADGRNPVIFGVAKKYVENFAKFKQKGKGLIIFGETSRGKTFLAACIANALIDKGYQCLMTNFESIIMTLSGVYEGKQAYIDSLNQYALLVIDDLGAERDTEYSNAIVQNVIDSRYRSGLPIIVTTNITKDEYMNPKNLQKMRTYSRLQEMCFPIACVGTDRRKEKAAVKDDEMRKILGIQKE